MSLHAAIVVTYINELHRYLQLISAKQQAEPHKPLYNPYSHPDTYTINPLQSMATNKIRSGENVAHIHHTGKKVPLHSYC